MAKSKVTSKQWKSDSKYLGAASVATGVTTAVGYKLSKSKGVAALGGATAATLGGFSAEAYRRSTHQGIKSK